MRFRHLLPLPVRLLLASFALFLSVSAVPAEELRTWTSEDGRQLQASLVHLADESVLLKLRNGREAEILLTRLSESDRSYLSALRKGSRAFTADPLPPETHAPEEIEVTGGPGTYFTPHFSFETEIPVSKAFISEAARIYEGTFEALSAIPHGLQFGPPAGKTHFQGSFLSDSNFDSIARERMPSLPGQRVVGLYLGDQQRLLVPYSSLGAQKLGSRLTLRKRSDTTTLVHEIVHQVMHRYLPLLPTWFSEGMAEYVSALPYQNGRFEFRNAERGLKERLEEEYRVQGREVEGVIRPSTWLAAAEDPSRGDLVTSSSTGTRKGPLPMSDDLPASPRAAANGVEPVWSGSVAEYRDALLLVYFFMHLDRPGEEGKPVGEYLHATNRAMEEADEILAEIERFEEERLAYNREVTKFNRAIDDYEADAVAYNERVTVYNNQLKQGIPEADLIEVGSPPNEPERPADLVMPERLRKLAKGGRQIDLVSFIETRALASLTANRSGEVIDDRMREAYDEIGIKISYRP